MNKLQDFLLKETHCSWWSLNIIYDQAIRTGARLTIEKQEVRKNLRFLS